MAKRTKFFCKTEGCSQEGKEVYIGKISYALREGKFVPINTPKCVDCGKQLSFEEYEDGEGIPDVKIGKFASLNNKQKHDVLKKRADKDFQKKGIELKEHYKNKTIKNFLGG